MTAREQPSQRTRIILGLIVLATGVPICLIGAGVIAPDKSSIHAPLWVVFVAGLVFVFAGGLLGLGGFASAKPDGSLPADTPWTLRLLQYLCGLVVIAALATVGSWVAFGSGPRNFTVTTSFLGSANTGPGDDTIGRIAFGFGAILTWLFFVIAAIGGARQLLDGDQ